jgi:hypothetical protein
VFGSEVAFCLSHNNHEDWNTSQSYVFYVPVVSDLCCMDKGLRRDIGMLIVSLYLVQRVADTRNRCCSSIFFRGIIKLAVNVSEHSVFINHAFFNDHNFSSVGLNQGLPGL